MLFSGSGRISGEHEKQCFGSGRERERVRVREEKRGERKRECVCVWCWKKRQDKVWQVTVDTSEGFWLEDG